MDPGEFDRRVSIVKLAPAGRDAAGAPTTNREVIGSPWAKVTYPGGREFLASEGEVTVRKVVFRIYPMAGVDVGVIVVLDGVDHDVQDIRPFPDVLELHAVSRAPAAAP